MVAQVGPPVARRDFLRRSLLVSLTAFFAQFGGASLAFLWPNLQGGFGSTLVAGTVSELISSNQQTGPFYFGAARSWIGYYGNSYKGVDTATQVDYGSSGAVAQGLMALYQKCAHLGCRVPYCASSQWFECPCHGSKYNRAGEYELGPAPNGLQRFPVTVDSSGNLLINTAAPIPGPPRGTNTINEPPQGPFCVAPG